MRWLLLALVLLAFAPAADALELTVVYVDWVEERALVPTTPLVGSPIAHEMPFLATECHPWLLLDLLYEPDSLVLAAPGVGEAAIDYEFRAEVWRNGTMVLVDDVVGSRHGHDLGRLDEPGEHTLRLSLAFGADVTYDARLRGRLATEVPACQEPVG